MKTQADKIKEYLLKYIPKHPQDIVAIAAKKFGVTRTTIHRHLESLIQNKKIIKTGTTRDVVYTLTHALNRELSYRIGPQLEEFSILTTDFDGALKQLPENIYDICTYAFTEIFNNAMDHSHGTKITAATFSDGKSISLSIADNGIGIFKNIYEYFHLDDIRESILQINKGKMTTDPINHSGEGLFFCARAFDIFEIHANGLHYYRDNRVQDWGVSSVPMSRGSKVVMTISLDSTTELVNVFKEFQEQDDIAFDRTEILVELSRLAEEKLISRSQAKRILRDLDKFKRVTLDFSGVKLVGQGFVDEVFRVYANYHPEMEFNYINANPDVTFMIKRGLATAKR
jgi:anti-sigma regulatory factor (Ser/Thr protein kinase)